MRTIDFAYGLAEVLRRSGLNLTRLAEKASLSRTHIEALKKGGSPPSTRLLQKICRALQQTGKVENRDIAWLLFSAVGIQNDELYAFLSNQPRRFSQPSYDVESCAIMTDALAECIHPETLTDTLRTMRNDDTEYFYFLPESSQDPNVLWTKIEHEMPAYLGAFARCAYCIRCPAFLIYCRIRIDNLYAPEPNVSLGLGHRDDPVLYSIDAEAVRSLIGFLKVLATKAKNHRAARTSVIRHEDLMFTLVDWDRIRQGLSNYEPAERRTTES